MQLTITSHQHTEPVDTATVPTVSNTGSLVFATTPRTDLLSHHPTPAQIFWLWQTYIDRVNPLVKILHIPTTQQMIMEESTDLISVPPSTEALMFAIYLSALTATIDAECQKKMGNSVDNIMAKYTVLVQQALHNANFMESSNLTTLQALTTFLVSKFVFTSSFRSQQLT